MIEYITERSKSTKIQKHICFCFLMSRRRWRVLDNCALESSKRCVFQGGIKMHDRSSFSGLLQWSRWESHSVCRREELSDNCVLVEIHANSRGRHIRRWVRGPA